MKLINYLYTHSTSKAATEHTARLGALDIIVGTNVYRLNARTVARPITAESG